MFGILIAQLEALHGVKTRSCTDGVLPLVGRCPPRSRNAREILYPEDGACAFTIGTDNNFTGYMDDIRVTDGVLPVSSFMRPMPMGTAIYVR